MFVCARTRCRDRYLPKDDFKDITEVPRHFDVKYILICGHSLCEKCLYMTVKGNDQNFFHCEKCDIKTTFSAHMVAAVKVGKLSSPEMLNWLNGQSENEVPVDAYSLGLALIEGHLIAKPVEIVTQPVPEELTQYESFKYNPDTSDNENSVLKEKVPSSRRAKVVPLFGAMQQAVKIHAEAGSSLKVLGNLEKKLSREYYETKMRLSEQFQVLHSLLQLEETKGLARFEEIYNRRKEEYFSVEKHLTSLRYQINNTIQSEHATDDQIKRKHDELKRLVAKPSRISWRNYETADEFRFYVDTYVRKVIKDCLIFKSIEKATTLTMETVDLSTSSSQNEPLPLFRSPPNPRAPKVPTPGTSPSADDPLPRSLEEKTQHVDPKLYEVKLQVLKEEEAVTVKMSKINTPHLFYLILWTDEPKIRRMNQEIEDWCTRTYTHPPSIATLKPGMFIFAYFDAVSRWVRARVLSVNAEKPKDYRKKTEESTPSAYSYYNSITADVQLLDYGGHERIAYSKLRQPFDELFDPESWPYLAIKCCMHQVDSKDEEWSDEAIEIMQRYGGDEKLICKIFKNDGDLHHVNLRHEDVRYRNGATLKEALIFSRCAIFKQEITPGFSFPQPDIHRTYDLDDRICFPGPIAIQTNRVETVLITSIVNPDLFYVTRYSEQEKFLQLHESLKIYFDLNETPYIIYTPKKGLPCVALDDGTFYRAEITKAVGADQAQVQFVDFGTTKVLSLERLRLIREEFLNVPIYAIPCKLADVGPIGFKWSDEANSKFQELCFGDPSGNSHLFNLSVVTFDSRGKHICDLRRFTGSEYMSVNVALVSLKFALSTGPLTETPADAAMLSQYDTNIDDRIFKAVENFNVNGFAILKELVNRNREAASSKVDSYIKMRVSHWTSPDEIYVQLTTPEVRSYFVCYENKIVGEFHKKLSEPIEKVYPSLEIGEFVVYVEVAEFSTIWRRGIIKKRHDSQKEITERGIDDEGREYDKIADRPGQKYIVTARDFGYQIDVLRKHIFRLPADSIYLKDGDFCIRCHLAGLVPAGGGGWTKTAIEEFGSLLKKYQNSLLLYIPDRFFPSSQPESVAVDIIANDNIIPDALSRATDRYYSFKNLLINRGLAIPTMKVDLSDIDDNPDNEEVKVKKSLIPYTNRQGDSVLGYIRNARAAVQREMNNTAVRFYKEVERPKEESFIAIPTEVNLDTKIWFRIHVIDGPSMINVINRSITNALKDQEQFLPFAGEFIFGRACTAYFDFDKTWNRAEILYELDETRTWVRFIDYGNEASVTREQLSSQVFHPEIPKLALNGFLAGFKSNAQGVNIELLRDQIHQLIVDHKCIFKWVNFQSLKEMQVQIVMPDATNLVDALIEKFDFCVAEITGDQPLIVIPPLVKEILTQLPLSGFKPSTLKFEQNLHYPVVVTGAFRNNYTFIQAKTIPYPATEIETEICERNKKFLTFLKEFRAEVHRFETDKKYKHGDPVAAQFSDNQWYRAMIMETSGSLFGDKYRVFYVDYGNSSVVETSKIKKLPKKYCESPELFAIPARVCNIKPAKGDKWESLLLDSMESKISQNENDTCALIKSRTDPWDIELYLADKSDPRLPVADIWTSLIGPDKLMKIETKPPTD